MSHKLWEARMNRSAVQAAEGLFDLAQPASKSDSKQSLIARAAMRAGLSYSRAWSIWYGKARRIDPAELEAIRDAQIKRTTCPADELRAIASEFEAIAERAARVLAGKDMDAAVALRRVAERAGRLAARA